MNPEHADMVALRTREHAERCPLTDYHTDYTPAELDSHTDPDPDGEHRAFPGDRGCLLDVPIRHP